MGLRDDDFSRRWLRRCFSSVPENDGWQNERLVHESIDLDNHREIAGMVTGQSKMR